MGTVVLKEKWPVLGRHERAAGWLRVWADLGRAPRTMDAYARGLAEYLEMCERVGVGPLGADRAHIASYVRNWPSGPAVGARTWCRSTRALGRRMPRCSSGWFRSGCFMTSWSRRGCVSPTRSVVAATRPATGAVEAISVA